MMARPLLNTRQKPVDDDYVISDHGYGKDHVKLLHVQRDGDTHTIKEFEVCSHLKLATQVDYIHGDNKDIVATDSQKNTIYLLAKRFGVKSPEQFGMVLCQHYLKTYSHVTDVTIDVLEYPWQRIKRTQGSSKKEHKHAFIYTPQATRHCTVHQKRGDPPRVRTGLKDLRVLKTTQSSFTGFVDDEYRSLPDSYDRIFSTIVTSSWEYSTTDGVDFDKTWQIVKDAILTNFAGCPDKGVFSPSVQNTLYLSERDVLNKVPQICAIEMQMPNKHYFNVDFSKFPRVVSGENKEVFMPVDKPAGIIYAQLDRKNVISKL